MQNLLASLLLLCSLSAYALDDVSAILAAADRFRLPAQSARVETLVELYKNDELEKSREYRVYLKPGRRSLVLFQAPQEAGQKVLMVEENFWMLMPKSSRPIRITPAQKLLGEASTGDIATMTWSEYYQGTVTDPQADYAGIPALRLELTSKVEGTTYAKIALWLERETYAPLAADLYVASGKLAKQARYALEGAGDQRRVMRMTLLDNIQKNQRTEVKILSLQAAELADKHFNPMFLMRNDIQEN